jgi:hypothetical protein
MKCNSLLVAVTVRYLITLVGAEVGLSNECCDPCCLLLSFAVEYQNKLLLIVRC